MSKLRLEVDELQVESFGTVAELARDGTVYGQSVIYTREGPNCPDFSFNCGYTPLCPGYGCTATSTCMYPTHVQDDCPPGWTDDEPACNIAQPQTYYCAGGTGTGGGWA